MPPKKKTPTVTESLTEQADDSSVPTYLGQSGEEFFKNHISKRFAVARFVDAYLRPYFNECMESFFAELYDPLVTRVWLGGSRAWYFNLQCDYGNSQHSFENLPMLTQAAVVPGNYDVFVMHTNPSTYRELYTRIRNFVMMDMVPHIRQLPLGDFVTARNQQLVVTDVYNVTVEEAKGKLSPRGGNAVEEDKMPMCALLKCYNLAINFQSRPGKYVDAVFPEFEDAKLMFYIEIGLLQNCNLLGFDALVSDERRSCVPAAGIPPSFDVLNFYGLFLMSQLIQVARKDKGIDVDTQRQQLIQRLVPPVRMAEVYSHVIQAYENIFSNTSFYSTDFLKQLMLQMFLNAYKQQYQVELVDEFEMHLVGVARPIVNSCIFMLNRWVQEAFPGDMNTFLVVVGGDAMRRYQPDISVTKDIDTKLYVNHKTWVNASKQKKLRNSVLTWMSCFTMLLNVCLRISATPFVKDVVILNKPYRLVFPNLEYTQPGGDTPFLCRLRYIQNNADFPVDLWSIDMRLPVTLLGGPTPFSTVLTVPILDVVVQDNVKGLTRADNVHAGTELTLPIASLNFLKNDLRQTYNDSEMASMRYWGNKNAKDEKRYMRLLALLRASLVYDPTLDAQMPVAKVQQALLVLGPNIIQEYRDNFVYLMDKQKREKVKFKLPFSQEKLTKLSDERQKEKRVTKKYDVMQELESLNTMWQM